MKISHRSIVLDIIPNIFHATRIIHGTTCTARHALYNPQYILISFNSIDAGIRHRSISFLCFTTGKVSTATRKNAIAQAFVQ